VVQNRCYPVFNHAGNSTAGTPVGGRRRGRAASRPGQKKSPGPRRTRGSVLEWEFRGGKSKDALSPLVKQPSPAARNHMWLGKLPRGEALGARGLGRVETQENPSRGWLPAPRSPAGIRPMRVGIADTPVRKKARGRASRGKAGNRALKRGALSGRGASGQVIEHPKEHMRISGTLDFERSTGPKRTTRGFCGVPGR
jgi:hypothetical protein